MDMPELAHAFRFWHQAVIATRRLDVCFVGSIRRAASRVRLLAMTQRMHRGPAPEFMPVNGSRRVTLRENFGLPTKNADPPAHYTAYLAWLRVRQQDW